MDLRIDQTRVVLRMQYRQIQGASATDSHLQCMASSQRLIRWSRSRRPCVRYEHKVEASTHSIPGIARRAKTEAAAPSRTAGDMTAGAKSHSMCRVADVSFSNFLRRPPIGHLDRFVKTTNAAKPAARAISVIGRSVSFSSCFAKCRRRVWAMASGDAPTCSRSNRFKCRAPYLIVPPAVQPIPRQALRLGLSAAPGERPPKCQSRPESQGPPRGGTAGTVGSRLRLLGGGGIETDCDRHAHRTNCAAIDARRKHRNEKFAVKRGSRLRRARSSASRGAENLAHSARPYTSSCRSTGGFRLSIDHTPTKSPTSEPLLVHPRATEILTIELRDFFESALPEDYPPTLHGRYRIAPASDQWS